MRGQFSGYFTPTDEEFAKLWSECLFAFDANVLLGLYRSTSDTQEIFFGVLEKIADRIFLPHQAASEYFKSRLGVISFRSDQYDKIKDESEKLSKLVQSIVQEHAILNGEKIADAVNEFSDSVCKTVDASVASEPDLLRSDGILAKLATFFETSTGQPYPPEKLKEIYGQGAQRYLQSIPPGYKDDKKGEPAKYGDLLIWFQLLDQAKAKNKPIVFVSGDAKEDWLQQHRGETLGPRPELRQEMMQYAGVQFWIYTTPRFLEFAKQFLNLKFDTKKAETEFEKIEKQERQPAAWQTFPITYHYSGDLFGSAKGEPLNWGAAGFSTQPINFGLGEVSYAGWTAPADAGPKQEFLQLLPLNGVIFNPPTGKWTCKIVGAPIDKNSDRALYSLEFEPQDRAMPTRTLKLWVSLSILEKDADWAYKKAINSLIQKFLVSNQASGETGLLP